MLNNKILEKILRAFPAIIKEAWAEENRKKYDEFVECFDDTVILIGEMSDIAFKVLVNLYNAAVPEDERILESSVTRDMMNPEQTRLYDAIMEKAKHIEITN